MYIGRYSVVRNPMKVFVLVFVLGLCLTPLVAYSITIEEFIKECPDAMLALGANCYPDGPSAPSRGSSGIMDHDPYSLSKNNMISFRDLYDSGILSDDMLRDLIRKADQSVDLANHIVCDGDTKTNPREYGNSFIKQEYVYISKDLGYAIINKIFGGIYDGMTIAQVKDKGPAFYLQLSLTNNIHKDTVEDAAIRVNGIDPTPPIYRDGQ
jgi:hypothetical protein